MVLNHTSKDEVRQTKTALAKKLGVSRGMLYYQHKRPIRDKILKADIEKVMKDNSSYGHKRIALELNLNKKRVLRVMKKFHLVPIRRRSRKPAKPEDLNQPESFYPNLIKNFCPIKPNIVWAADFTYIKFRSDWVYLSTVIDIYTREIIGWHLSTSHHQDLGELIEVVAQTLYYYNHQRIHTKLKTSPVKFRLDREYLFKELGT